MTAPPSYVHGTSPVPLPGETIGDDLRRAVALARDREAVVVRSQGARMTYGELWDAHRQGAEVQDARDRNRRARPANGGRDHDRVTAGRRRAPGCAPQHRAG